MDRLGASTITDFVGISRMLIGNAREKSRRLVALPLQARDFLDTSG